MKLEITSYTEHPHQKPAPAFTYGVEATMNTQLCIFKITGAELELILDGANQLPPHLDYGMSEPMICMLLRMVHSVYAKKGVPLSFLGASIDLVSPNSTW